jgi:hypothetical protein
MRCRYSSPGAGADVVIVDQVQISAGTSAQDEATRPRLVPPHALGVWVTAEPS